MGFLFLLYTLFYGNAHRQNVCADTLPYFYITKQYNFLVLRLTIYHIFMTAIKHKGQRVGVFIDAQNLYHSAKNLYGRRVNFGNILETAVGDRTLIRALAYVITTESGEESEFFEALSKQGIETKAKDLQIFLGGAKKADWDVGLAIDAVKAAPKLDTVVLVSGDGDFIPLVEYLQHNEGCQVEVISFAKSSSAKLIDACDDFVDMSEDLSRYLLNYRYKRNTRKNTQIAAEKIDTSIKDNQEPQTPEEKQEIADAKRKRVTKNVQVKKTQDNATTQKKATVVKSKIAKKKTPKKEESKKPVQKKKKQTGGVTIRKA